MKNLEEMIKQADEISLEATIEDKGVKKNAFVAHKL